ncbi:hypothetical protein LTR53_000552 [Teratosphaeriaceae sp. CCFEE 6253]|nr:hypothetical protein LTR53_000552 [Teratosphaeriaceae sp. CCFEE 6253]
MSDGGSDSDTGSGSGSSDSASYVAPARQQLSLAALRTQHVQPLIHDPRWSSSSDDGYRHLAIQAYSFPTSANDQPRTLGRTGSDAASMAALAMSSRSTTWKSTSSTGCTPSLGSYPTVSSTSSISTADADLILPQTLDLLDDVDGVLVQQLPVLQCPYSILDCAFTSTDLDQWDIHGLAHFRGQLPKTWPCPFEGCSKSFEAEKSEQAWSSRRVHLHSHRVADRVVIPVDCRHAHVDHLWRVGIISKAEFKELKQHGKLEAGSAPYLASAGNASEERRRQRPPAERRAERMPRR